jgi:hypothetical protein
MVVPKIRVCFEVSEDCDSGPSGMLGVLIPFHHDLLLFLASMRVSNQTASWSICILLFRIIFALLHYVWVYSVLYLECRPIQSHTYCTTMYSICTIHRLLICTSRYMHFQPTSSAGFNCPRGKTPNSRPRPATGDMICGVRCNKAVDFQWLSLAYSISYDCQFIDRRSYCAGNYGTLCRD